MFGPNVVCGLPGHSIKNISGHIMFTNGDSSQKIIM